MKTTKTWIEILENKYPEITRSEWLTMFLYERGIVWKDDYKEEEKAMVMEKFYTNKTLLKETMMSFGDKIK
jgi:hypothetical protein